MDRTKFVVRAKDLTSGLWTCGTPIPCDDGKIRIVDTTMISYHYIEEIGDVVHSETIGLLAPRKDAEGKQVFEGDIIQYEDEYYYFDVTAEVKFGEYLQDGSDGEYGGAKVYGWYVEVLSATPPEFDDEAEYPEYLKTTSILGIPTFKVVGNVFNEK